MDDAQLTFDAIPKTDAPLDPPWERGEADGQKRADEMEAAQAEGICGADRRDAAMPVTGRGARSSSPGGLVFGFLILLGVGTFTPCIVLPEWREFQAIQLVEQQEQHRLAAIQRVVDRERRMLEALQSDPAVIGRLAQRDLGFSRPADRVVATDIGEQTETVEEPFSPIPVKPPAVVARFAALLPDFDYDIFCDPTTRPILMGMSVLLILAALAIFQKKPSAAQHCP